MVPTAVILLRAPDADNKDRYEIALEEAGYAAVSVAALDTGFVNEDAFRVVIQTRASDFDGVIVTSSRACDAWKRAAQDIYPASSASNDWTTKPFYAVGHATATALREIADSPAAPRDVRGEESGTGEQLARFIVDDVRAGDATRGHPTRLLYLTGDKNRDTVPKILAEAGVAFEPLQVYGTCGRPDFAGKLDEAVQRISAADDPWVVFFASSSTDFALPFLRQHFSFRQSTSLEGSNAPSDAPVESEPLGVPTSNRMPATHRTARIAAIGPVSSDHISRELHLHVDAVATKPSPANLVDAIRAAPRPAFSVV
ncbi:tetrapyrrole biosynthesis, uroporphyrinogen III synthase [Schizophyllum amplum]|uniref:Tetrapyrrole biosynthesis, uroporphyrinogen III synthase n=1 Tax=Schizophyllum amplum TaxID=97359 RepID=A0A550CUJ2_9AGAR|nr:tetrapyrrole biosynthesis, uroporphyrinogen III synthase [Auriculariopsis ampla]